MEITDLVIFLVIGTMVGWLAGTIMKSGGFGLPANILIGIVGGVVSGFLFRLMEISRGGLISLMVTAAVGSTVLLYAVGLFKNGKKSSIHYKGDELWIQRKPLNRR
jgi:uncharacterized membrane protein YeaQ/YmgE (transglycosylase-associated protein family)